MIPESADCIRWRRTPMLNGAIAQGRLALLAPNKAAGTAVRQKLVIVNDSPEVLEQLETVLEAGHYDVVFVESNEHAYSRVKRVQPDLVILCARIDDMDAFQVLSMLRLDSETQDIPVLTYTTDSESQDAEKEGPGVSETAMFPWKAAEIMN
jgi:CheY-like chemotaxis protein